MINKFIYACFGSFNPTEQSAARSGAADNRFGQIRLKLSKSFSFLIPHIDYFIITHHDYRLMVVSVKEMANLHALAQREWDFHRQLLPLKSVEAHAFDPRHSDLEDSVVVLDAQVGASPLAFVLGQFEPVHGQHFQVSALLVVVGEPAHHDDHAVMHNCPVTASSCMQPGFTDEFLILVVEYLYYITLLVIREHASTHYHHPVREQTHRIQWVARNSLQLITFYSLTVYCGVENLKRVGSRDYPEKQMSIICIFLFEGRLGRFCSWLPLLIVRSMR